MSLASWMAEFYPIDARDVPKDQAVDHSLQKWRGLRRENLEKHRLELDDWFTIRDYKNNQWFLIEGESCALCVRYFFKSCIDCPITRSRGAACDKEVNGLSPWRQRKLSVEPMIQALEAAAEWEKEL